VPSIDFIIAYLVVMGEKSIFFLEINPPGHVNETSSRIAADDLMRDRFGSLFNLAPLPKLHGISVMGQMLALYCLDKATGNVYHEYVSGRWARIMDVVPANTWDSDITTAAGYQRFVEVVKDVRGRPRCMIDS